jgi:hypothetical protein
MRDSYYANCYLIEVLDQRTESSSQDYCYPSRFSEYHRRSPQSVVGTDGSDATADENYCAICSCVFEEPSSSSSVAFSPWEGV